MTRDRPAARMLRAAIVAVSTVLAGSSTLGHSTHGRVDVPVMVGAHADLDACPSTGTVVGLNPRGDGFLSVQSGPGGKPYRQVDRVYNGMHLWICDQVGRWYAVVYSPDGRMDCNVSAPRSGRQQYTGPCRYGWVHSRYVGNLAG
jgi:hypothetical protein